MKKTKDILGDILRAMIILSLIALVIGIIQQFASDNVLGGIMYIGALLGCLFFYWLILSIGKIIANLKEINENFSDFFSMQKDFFKVYYNQINKKDNNPDVTSHKDI